MTNAPFKEKLLFHSNLYLNVKCHICSISVHSGERWTFREKLIRYVLKDGEDEVDRSCEK